MVCLLSDQEESCADIFAIFDQRRSDSESQTATSQSSSRRCRTSLREALDSRIADFKGCFLLPLLLLLFEKSSTFCRRCPDPEIRIFQLLQRPLKMCTNSRAFKRDTAQNFLTFHAVLEPCQNPKSGHVPVYTISVSYCDIVSDIGPDILRHDIGTYPILGDTISGHTRYRVYPISGMHCVESQRVLCGISLKSPTISTHFQRPLKELENLNFRVRAAAAKT